MDPTCALKITNQILFHTPASPKNDCKGFFIIIFIICQHPIFSSPKEKELLSDRTEHKKAIWIEFYEIPMIS